MTSQKYGRDSLSRKSACPAPRCGVVALALGVGIALWTFSAKVADLRKLLSEFACVCNHAYSAGCVAGKRVMSIAKISLGVRDALELREGGTGGRAGRGSVGMWGGRVRQANLLPRCFDFHTQLTVRPKQQSSQAAKSLKR